MSACVMAPGFLKFKLRMGGRSLSLTARMETEVLLNVGRMCKASVPIVGRKSVGTATLEANMKNLFFSSQLSHNRGGHRFKKRTATTWIGRLADGAKTNILIQD